MKKLRASGRACARSVFALALVAAAFATGFASGGYGSPAANALPKTHGSGWASDRGQQEMECLPGREGCGSTLSSSMVQVRLLEQENDRLRRQIAEISLKNAVLRSEANDDH